MDGSRGVMYTDEIGESKIRRRVIYTGIQKKKGEGAKKMQQKRRGREMIDRWNQLLI